MSEKKALKRKKFDTSYKLDAVSRVKSGEKQLDVHGWIPSEASIKNSTLHLDESEGLTRKD